MPAHVRLLILEDEPADVELMVYELRRAGLEADWQCVTSEADYLAHLDQLVDVILADYTLPQFDAMKALYLLQDRRLDIPFIIVTGTISEEIAVDCMKQGAADYLLKDRLARLGPAVRQAIHQKQLRDEKRRAEAALRESEERFRRLAENAQDIIYRYRLAPDQGFEYVSPAVTAITGYSPEEYYADPDLALKLVHPDDRDVLEQMFTSRADWLPQPVLLCWRRKDGALFWTEHLNTPVYAGDGRLVAIEGIARDVTQTIQAEEQLKRSLQEKEVLLREVHHRVKNNLQAISNLLYLQAETIEDQQARDMFREAQDRIKSIALIHQKLYQSDNLARIDFKEYVHSLAVHLIRSIGVNPDTVLVQIEVEETFLDLDTAVTLGIIINELISNSLKHAFPPSLKRPPGQKGEITVGLRAHTGDERLVLTVGDNGVGISPAIDISSVQSLGLQLVYMLASHMKAEVELKQSEGTVFEMTFALPAQA